MTRLFVRLQNPVVLFVIALCVVVVAVAVWAAVRPSGSDDVGEAPPADAPYRDASLPVDERVADLLGRMTVEEKVGQMTQAVIDAVDGRESDIARFGLGSLLNGGSEARRPTPEAWGEMIDGYQREALDTRLGIPLMYGFDAVHGNPGLPGAVVFPHNIGLGAAGDPDLAERAAAITAIETRVAGIHWNFAPCLCVARDSRWGRTYESFGEDSELVTSMAVTVRGYQGDDLSANTSVLATAKHYVGDGGTTFGSSTTDDYTLDQGVTELSEEELRRIHLGPFEAAVELGVGSIMASFSSTDRGDGPLKVHADRYLLTDVLKGELGFEGFIVSDWEAVDQITPGDYAESVRTAINAGIDMVMVPFEYQRFIDTLLAEIASGNVAEDRIDDAVGRILTKKFELGLFERPFADTSRAGEVGSDEHRAVAREAAAASQVLLRNDGDLLPLPDTASVYVAGAAADSLGHQLGGWSGSWQGGLAPTSEGTTILAGLAAAAPGATVHHSADASDPIDGYDVGVVVVGERPYAEGIGDVGAGEHRALLRADDAEAIATVCAAVDCVVIVVSGRPIELGDHLDGVDALVAAWLPGSEGAGVADPLFGNTPYTGTLPVTWPRSLDDEPINVGDADYDPLFPYGFGIATG